MTLRLASALLVATTIATLPSIAHADAYGRRLPDQDPDSKIAVELRFGAYRPDVDNAFASATPYRDTFETDWSGGTSVPCPDNPAAMCSPSGNNHGHRFMIGAEVDWQFLHVAHIGSLGVGGQIGYWSASAKARFADGSGQSDEEVSLKILPINALLVARIDGIARETPVPLVPYVKLGVGCAFWSSANETGVSQDASGRSGRGKTFGAVYAAGAMLMLDFLDRQTAKSFSNESGVHHTYAFGEYTITDYEGFGSSTAMHLGDKTWNVGVAFEM
jgi:hypothetical protein